jgi:hypothetical protein
MGKKIHGLKINAIIRHWKAGDAEKIVAERNGVSRDFVRTVVELHLAGKKPSRPKRKAKPAEYRPTPQQVADAARIIRDGWTHAERQRRKVGGRFELPELSPAPELLAELMA